MTTTAMSSMCFITISHYRQYARRRELHWTNNQKLHLKISFSFVVKWLLKKNCRKAKETMYHMHWKKTLPFVVTLHIYISTILPLMSITWILQEEEKNKHLIQEIESKRIRKELLWAPSAWIWRAHIRRSTHRHRCRLKLMHKYFTFLHVESTISIVQNIKISGNIISTMVWRAILKSTCPGLCVCLCFKCDSVRHLCVYFCVVFFVV